MHSPTGDKIAGVTKSMGRFFDPVGMGVPPANLHEKPAVGNSRFDNFSTLAQSVAIIRYTEIPWAVSLRRHSCCSPQRPAGAPSRA
ncbi:hypothetical protein SBA3_1590001 [Candidatus Sulfopaludibacter sp. SbA3]|nr:hypothetical protein SBA3_1590001 [Candidatus Sulfopaludibacter sp. SbA3]